MDPPLSSAVHSKPVTLLKHSARELQRGTHPSQPRPTAPLSHLPPLGRALTSTTQHSSYRPQPPAYHSQPPTQNHHQRSTLINRATAPRPQPQFLSITELSRRANITPRRRSLPSSKNPSADLRPPPGLTPTASFQAYQARLLDATHKTRRLKIASDHYLEQMAEERHRETARVRQERDEDGQPMSWIRERTPPVREVIDLTREHELGGAGSVFEDERWVEGRYYVDGKACPEVVQYLHSVHQKP